MNEKQIHLLYVEDDETAQATLKERVISRSLPYKIDGIKTVTGAIALIESNNYELILLECRLPDGTGLELLEKTKKTPAIFIASPGDEALAAEALKKGAYSYLIKNTDGIYPELLASIIEKVLYLAQLEQTHKKNQEQFSLLEAEVERMQDEIKASLLEDPLTGLATKRLMGIILGRSVAIAKRYGNALSFLMLNIDNFKKYNDTYGYPAGDRLLVVIGKILLEEIRDADFAAQDSSADADTDFAARYSAEEFFILLPDTNEAGACNIAERIRKTVKECVGVTISIGVLTYHKGIKNAEDVLNKLKQAMYQAKQKGRDRLEVSGE